MLVTISLFISGVFILKHKVRPIVFFCVCKWRCINEPLLPDKTDSRLSSMCKTHRLLPSVTIISPFVLLHRNPPQKSLMIASVALGYRYEMSVSSPSGV